MTPILKCHDIVKTDFVRGTHCYLYDAQGRRYVDLESGIWCTVLGHNHPRINQVIKRQIEELVHLGTRYPNAMSKQAAIDVLELVGFAGGKCTFLSSGSEAVEFGVQAARRIVEKPLLLTFSHSYLGAYGSAGRKNAEDWHLLDWREGDPLDVDACLRDVPLEQIGAFVFEPGGSGSAFVRFPPRPLVDAIVQRVRASGGLIVINEVTTGMGRTGTWFGFQHYDIRPDIVALGKGLGNGYPVSAVTLARDVAEKVEASGLHYAQSHQNDPLGCAIARTVIQTLREGGLG